MLAPSRPAYRRSHDYAPHQATSSAAYVGAPPDDDDPLLQFAPFIHPQPKRSSITPPLQRQFVAALAATGIVNQAARSIGKSMEALYMLRKRPGAEGFAAAWDEALTWGLDRLEDCALERALSGGPMDDPLGGRGDALLCLLLQQRRAHRVDERDIRPGHPVYERIRAEVIAQHAREAGQEHAESPGVTDREGAKAA